MICHSDDDGDCTWPHCPQLRDGEPKRSRRHCPLDHVNVCRACGESEECAEHDRLMAIWTTATEVAKLRVT